MFTYKDTAQALRNSQVNQQVLSMDSKAILLIIAVKVNIA